MTTSASTAKPYLFEVAEARSFAHQEVNNERFLAQIDPEASIAAGKSWDQSSDDKYVIVELDSYFPKPLTANLEHYQQYILEVHLML